MSGRKNNLLLALLSFPAVAGNTSGVLMPKILLSMKLIPLAQFPSRILPNPCRSFCLPAKFHKK